MKKVLLFSGKMSSGKNQFADYIKEIYESKGLGVISDLFAADLKEWSKNDFKGLSDVLNNLSSELQFAIKVLSENRKSYGIPDDGVTDKLKQIASKLIIKDENWFEKKTDITRTLLQTYGTQIFRERVDTDFWMKRTKQRIEEYNTDIVLITDVRFPNEIDFIANSDKYETYSVRINRPLNREGQQHEHISEIALDGYQEFSYIIENNAGLSELKESAFALIEDIESMNEEIMV